MPAILALDFGGAKHTAGRVDWPFEAGSPLVWRDHRRQFTPHESNFLTDYQIMLDLARQLLNGEKTIGVGVSFGGPVDAATRTVRLSHHVPGWENIRLGELLEAEFGCPVWIDNDANVGALGEYHFGAGKGSRSLMYITISTGVGGGWIFDGKLWHGADGMAGEIGHTVIDPAGPLCLCGKRGCLERLASGPYMAQDALQLLNEFPERASLIRRLAQQSQTGAQPVTITGQMISQAASEGDDLAIEILDRAAWALGVGIGNAANLINPQRFILGGGVTKSGDRFWRAVQDAARRTALPQIHFEILPAALGDDAPLWGAIALVQTCQ